MSILTIAVSLAAATILVCLIQGFFLSPLPPEQDDFIAIQIRSMDGSSSLSGVERTAFFAWRREVDALKGLVAMGWIAPARITGGTPENIRAASISDGFLSLLEVPLLRGREFTDGELLEEKKVVVISHSLWQGRFGGSQEILDRRIELDGETYDIVGVLSRNARVLELALDVLVPISPELVSPNGISAQDLLVIARPIPKSTREQVRLQLQNSYNLILGSDFGGENRPGVVTMKLGEYLVAKRFAANARRDFLAGSIAFVLILICVCIANVTNALLARTLKRGRDFAVRTSVGAGPLQILRIVLSEAGLLFFLGLLGSFPLAVWAFAGLRSVLPDFVPYFSVQSLRLDLTLSLLTLALAVFLFLVTCILPGLAALRLSRMRVGPSTQRLGFGFSALRASRVFIMVEVAVAGVLTIGTVLLLISVRQLGEVHLGFDPHNVKIIHVVISESQLTRRTGETSSEDDKTSEEIFDAQKYLSFLRSIESEVRRQPEVLAVGLTTNLFSEVHSRVLFSGIQSKFPLACRVRPVSAGYFTVLGIDLLRGSLFEDRESDRRVALLTRSSYPKLWPDNGPLGLTLELEWKGPKRAETIGVVRESRELGLDTPAGCVVYVPLAQGRHYLPARLLSEVNLLVRLDSAGSARDVFERVNQVVGSSSLDAEVRMNSLEGMLAAQSQDRRILVALLGGAALFALVLVFAGLSSILVFEGRLRSREIGVRLALGARRPQVLFWFLKDSLIVVAAGSLGGVILGMNAAQVLRSQVFGVEVFNVGIGLLTAAFVFLIGIGSCWKPAFRASRVDPSTALRE